MIVISHRGNLVGPRPSEENKKGSLEYCLARGWAVETDVRCGEDGRFYVSHDPTSVTEENEARGIFRSWKRYPDATIALNVKECGQEAELIHFLSQEGVIKQIFLFDMELVEDVPGRMAKIFRRASPSVRLAARVSDRNEPLDRALAIREAEVIWLDEFDHPWTRPEDVRRLKEAGKRVCAVSPDLHGFSLDVSRRRWEDFFLWGVDGICTDYPVLLDKSLQGKGRGL